MAGIGTRGILNPTWEMYRPTGVKKTPTKFGKIAIKNNHKFSIGANGFQVSPFLQNLFVYAG